MSDVLRVRYPDQNGLGLGRNVNHDSRSRRFPVRADKPITSVRWERRVPIFNQSDLGSCTGNAGLGCMGTDPFFGTVANGQPWVFDQAGAVDLYSAATTLDAFFGTYPPTDTGSDGLSIAKVLQSQGWISGYTHAFGLEQFLSGLMSAPCIVGTEWTEAMSFPDAEGVVRVIGQVQGGHEYCAVGFEADRDLVWFANSWGPEWAKDGYFAMTTQDFGALLARNGDATFFTPVTAPAPRPIPEQDPDRVLADALRTWAGKSQATTSRKQRAAVAAWLKARGL